MNDAQASIGVPLLNSYAHQYLGLTERDVMIAAGRDRDTHRWKFIVAIRGTCESADDFDAAKAMIDRLK